MVAGCTPGSRPLLSDDEDFIGRWRAAIERKPEEERAIQTEILELCCDIERKVLDCSLLVRDCNVILARTIDRLVRFEATGPQTDASR